MSKNMSSLSDEEIAGIALGVIFLFGILLLLIINSRLYRN